jgi:deoxyribonuclease V
MDFPERHSWNLNLREAEQLQESLAGELNTTVSLGQCEIVAAADCSYNKFDPRMFAAVVVLNAVTFEVIETVGVQTEATFPYVPGLLSFRELPAVLEVFRSLKTRPDVVLCDGQGIAHPRRMGIASHLGLWLQIPTVGCAKSRLCGRYEEPGPNRGDRSPLTDHGETIGTVLRSRSRVKPLYVSPGHLCDMESAVRVVLEDLTKYRLPVGPRLAHEEVNRLRRAAGPADPAVGETPTGLEPFLDLE